MSITNELEAKILRHFHVEKWKIGTIARQLNVHHNSVERVLSQAGVPRASIIKRTSIIDSFLPFIVDVLKKFPTLRARRLYDMIRTRGYSGGPDHFRHIIAMHRPRAPAEAFLRLKTLPGEQAQVDWAHFGYITIGEAKRALMAFVMVLSFSRRIFLRFYLNQKLSNFLRGHEAAFNYYGGVPRVLLMDNLKSAVLERQGNAIRFHPTLLDFSAHYRYEPRPVAVARGNEKGRVERSIRYIRDSFFAARQWKDLDDLNAQAAAWCDGQASDRPCPEDPSLTVRTAFEQEKTKLITLPDNPYPTDECEEVKIGKTPYARFDLNDYSIPHTYVRRTLTVSAQPDKVTIIDGANIIAQHQRCYDRGQQIEQEEHIKELVQRKSQARQHRGQNRLTKAVPSSLELLIQAADHNYNLGSITSSLLQLLDDYGAAELEAAIAEALSRSVPHPNAVRISLERRREEREQLPLVHLELPQDKRVRELHVRPHDLSDYDKLKLPLEEKNNDNK
jgi:transposase